MRMILRNFAALLVMACAGACASDPQPVRQIGIYVLPYYQSAVDGTSAPTVGVARAYNALLASTDARDIEQARDEIGRDNAMITPMTLMVLAIRLYDVGLREQSVFWFYAAKDRYLTAAGVLNMHAPELADAADAVASFATLAGPVINGYAFCDIGMQQKAESAASQWTIDHPYQAIFMPQLPARPGDRAHNLAQALSILQDNIDKERAVLHDPQALASMRAVRAANGADVKYCWKRSKAGPG